MSSNATQKKPNVLIFFTDQQRWDTTGVHGNPMGLTPNFDMFARQGTDVHCSFTCQPVCAPARACLHTSRYATQTGVFRNGNQIRPEDQSIAKVFAANGYDTGYIGKWHLFGGEENAVPAEYRSGYDFWLAANVLEFVSYPYNTVLYNNSNEETFLPGYRVDALTDAAIRWIAEPRDQPFYLMLSFLEPHQQNQWDSFPAPEGYDKRYIDPWVPADLRALGGTAYQHLPGYYGMVRKLDEAFGRIRDALRSLGQTENTIVVFSSDHGCHFKTRNGEYKRSPHDGSLRVPTAISGPGFSGYGRFSGLFSIVDIAPTVLDACGIDIPSEFEGHSILASRNSGGAWPDDIFFQISENTVGRGVRTRRWKYAIAAPDADPFSDEGSDNYVETHLYDLAADPYELTNLVELPQYEPLKLRLRERLERHVKRVEQRPCRIKSATNGDAERRVEDSQIWGSGQRSVRPEDIDL